MRYLQVLRTAALQELDQFEEKLRSADPGARQFLAGGEKFLSGRSYITLLGVKEGRRERHKDPFVPHIGRGRREKLGKVALTGPGERAETEKPPHTRL
jgi:hypothetical protein